MTGKPYLAHAHFMDSPTDVLGRKLDDEAKGFDLTLITYRHITQSKSRTVGNYWLLAVYPENFIDISVADARRLGLKDGDQVKVVSPTNEEGVWDLAPGHKKPMIGKVRTMEGMRPGVIGLYPGPRPLGLRRRGRGHRRGEGPRRSPPGYRHPRQRRHAGGPGLEKYRPGGSDRRQRRVLPDPGKAGEGVTQEPTEMVKPVNETNLGANLRGVAGRFGGGPRPSLPGADRGGADGHAGPAAPGFPGSADVSPTETAHRLCGNGPLHRRRRGFCHQCQAGAAVPQIRGLRHHGRHLCQSGNGPGLSDHLHRRIPGFGGPLCAGRTGPAAAAN